MALFLPEELTEVESALDYLRNLLIVKPLNAFTLFPESTLGGRLWHSIRAQAVLCPARPEALVAPAI